jgi:lipopolysaccharide heptosyltransferase I
MLLFMSGSNMNLLLIKPSSLGDLIHAIPVVLAIKNIHPNCKITWLVNATFAPLVHLVPGVDEVLIFDRGAWKEKRNFFQNLKKMGTLIHTLRARKFDTVLDLQGLFRSGLLAFLTGAPKRLGLDTAREGSRFFYTEIVNTVGKTHALDKNMSTLTALFPKSLPQVHFKLCIPEEIHNKVSTLLKELHCPEPFCVLAPGARWLSKKWPSDHFFTLAKKIHTELKKTVILIGDPSDQEEWASHLQGQNPVPGIFSLLGKTTLIEVTEIIRRAEFLICNDSGPMHLAVALGTKVFALMGPTAPSKTGPYRNAEVIRLDLQCSPCLERICPRTDKPQECLKEISPEQVLASLSLNIKDKA